MSPATLATARGCALLCLVLLPPRTALPAGAEPADKAAMVQAVASGTRPDVNRAVDRFKLHDKPRDVLVEIGKLLFEGDARARQNAAYFFAHTPERAYADKLLQALDDEEVAVREWGCVALGKLKHRPAVRRLAELTRDGSPAIRREAVRALGRIGDKAGVPAAVALVEDVQTEPRVAAILALGEIGHPRAVPRLLPLLEDSSETTRLAAAKSLCMLGHVAGRRFAEKLLGATEPSERRDGITLVEEVKAPWVRAAMFGLLQDPNLRVWTAAAKALARQGDGRGVERLVLAAASAEPSEAVRIEAVIEELGVTREDRRKILAAGTK